MTTGIPINRVVSVTVDRNDSFPTKQGFGTPIILTNESVADVLDASNLVATYTSMADVANDWDATDKAYQAALAMFSQNPAPPTIKMGFINEATPATATDQDFQDAMDAIVAVDADWYIATLAYPLRDVDGLDGLIAWFEATGNAHIVIIDSHDALLKDDTDDTNVAARNKTTYERTAVIYNGATTGNAGPALAAVLSTKDFDQANSAYTAKFKNLRGQSAADITGAEVQAITGFTPGVGQSDTVGHLANAYIRMGGQNFVVEGSVLKVNVFIDEIHAGDWLIARTGEALLGRLLNNDRVPYTNDGMEILAGAVKEVLNTAVRAGWIADYEDTETGEILPAYDVTFVDVDTLPEAQRKSRIAPSITATFRYAGAVHYTSVNFNMTF